MRYILVFILAGFVAGCSTLPGADKITGFGSAVEQSSQSLEIIAAENLRIALLSEQEEEAVNYVRGDDYKVLSTPQYRIAEREFKFRRTQLKALAGYGAALKEASDPKKIQDIKDASTKLASAVGGIAALAPGGAAVVTPVINAAGKAAGIAITDRYARKVNGIIVDTDPYVQAVVRNLKEDFRTINHNSERRFDAYQKKIWLALSETRSKEVEVTSADGKTETRLEVRDPDHPAPLYAQFIGSNERVVGATTALEGSKSAEGVLDRIAAAHSALKNGTATAKPSIDDLLTFSDDLTALATAAKGK
ncbi:hypothetical protein E0H64_13975 [Rhizobium leguminosarum bv. viciae]|uniref:hypothetical protein n=1 Tax=Rhizobium leguminosarum TaxID=384 RepID=UPI00103D371B|nr:hypothetical protein [Rhizobium leguminosarum]MBY2967487.1 hypothetical protein [Rhizobium leguminosarum]TBZ68440.1 hypothetical protein E0H64_13975 [Rhizobium leguminosarum bv. viciae]